MNAGVYRYKGKYYTVTMIANELNIDRDTILRRIQNRKKINGEILEYLGDLHHRAIYEAYDSRGELLARGNIFQLAEELGYSCWTVKMATEGRDRMKGYRFIKVGRGYFLNGKEISLG